MTRAALILMVPVMLLWQSCAASKLSEIRDDIGTLAKNGVAITKAVRDLPAQLDASVEKAKADLAAKGAPVDGTPAELTKWAAQNPGTAFSSLGAFLAVLAASLAKYRTAKKAAIVAVDAVEALPPEAKDAFKAQAETNAHMTAGVASFITALKNR